MKRLITYSIFCLIAILVLPSCKGKMNITKRHYLKGYYVSHTKAKDKPNVVRARSSKVEADKIGTLNVLSAKAKESSMKDRTDLQPKERTTASAFPKRSVPEFAKDRPNFKSITINEPLKQLKRAKVTPGNAGDREGLSLFWIIILVILILWLFGYLAGSFGALINILLIIALVLLILWLLRVV